MAPVARKWPHLPGPAPAFDRFRPGGADQYIRAPKLVEGVIARRVGLDPAHLSAHRHRQLDALVARDRQHAGHAAEAGYVLAVVDLVEELLLRRIDVHAGQEQVRVAVCHRASTSRYAG